MMAFQPLRREKKREGGWRGYWVPTGEEIEEAAEPDVPDGLVPKFDLTPS